MARGSGGGSCGGRSGGGGGGWCGDGVTTVAHFQVLVVVFAGIAEDFVVCQN